MWFFQPGNIFATFAASLLLVGLTVFVSAEPNPVIGKAVFNNPAGSEIEQYVIFQQLARLIDRVPAGEYIEMSWWGFVADYTTDTASKPNLPQRLIKAHKRGVNVRIILDNNKNFQGSGNSQLYPYKTLSTVLGTKETAPSFILVCPDRKGCIAKRKIYSGYAFNHNKFLLASRIVLDGGATVSNVVFQSSGNLGTWDADTVWNNAVTWSETASFNNYHKYFGDLRANYNGRGNDNYYWVGASSDIYQPYFFPRRETNGDLQQASTDTIVGILNSVKCSYVSKEDGKKYQTNVRILMWAFTRVDIAEQLASLIRAGCWVDIAYYNMSKEVTKALQNAGGKVGVTKCAVPWQGRTLMPHSKYMLIDGAYDNDQVPIVFTGSPNYEMSALRNADETLVRIRSVSIHSSYLQDNFYKIRDICSGKTKLQ